MTAMTESTVKLKFSVDDLIEGVKSGGITSLQRFEDLCVDTFVADERISKENYYRALAAIAARHNITVPQLKERIADYGLAAIRQVISEDGESPHSDDLPDTEIVRAIKLA